jgi:hypothetical protein
MLKLCREFNFCMAKLEGGYHVDAQFPCDSCHRSYFITISNGVTVIFSVIGIFSLSVEPRHRRCLVVMKIVTVEDGSAVGAGAVVFFVVALPLFEYPPICSAELKC